MSNLVRKLRTRLEEICCKLHWIWGVPTTSSLVNAAWGKRKDWVEKWLERGANVNFKGMEGKTALYWATINGDESTVELLLAYSAEVDVIDNKGIAPLHIAAAYGDKIITEILLSKGASVNVRDKFSQTPLHKAIQNSVKVVETYDMLEQLSPEDSHRDKPRERDYEKIVRLLLANKADINAKDNCLDTPLHRAALRGDKFMVKLLLDNGADIEAKNSKGATPLQNACVDSSEVYEFEEKEKVIELLLDEGAEINSRDSEGRTPLHLSINYGFSDSRRDLLLSLGADIHAKNNNGYSPLHYAAGAGFSRVGAPQEGEEYFARQLLEKGADVNAKSSEGTAPLHSAAGFGYYGIVQILLDNGADVNIQDKILGRTPLHDAVFEYKNWTSSDNVSDANAREKLLEISPQLESLLNNKDCASNRYQTTIELLLQHGANINIQDKEGRTPLHIAVYYSREEALIKILLAHGADTTIKNNEGKTPVDIVASGQHPEILELLNKET